MLMHELNAPIESLCDIFQLNCQLVDENREKVTQLKTLMTDLEMDFSLILKKSGSDSNVTTRTVDKLEEQKIEEESEYVEEKRSN